MTSVYEHNQLRLRVKDLELENADLKACISSLKKDLEQHRRILLVHLAKFDELNLIIETLRK